MTDRIKGYLVTLEGDIRKDDAEQIEIAIRMIKRVHSIKPYIKGAEDYMMEEKSRYDAYQEMLEAIYKKLKNS